MGKKKVIQNKQMNNGQILNKRGEARTLYAPTSSGNHPLDNICHGIRTRLFGQSVVGTY